MRIVSPHSCITSRHSTSLCPASLCVCPHLQHNSLNLPDIWTCTYRTNLSQALIHYIPYHRHVCHKSHKCQQEYQFKVVHLHQLMLTDLSLLTLTQGTTAHVPTVTPIQGVEDNVAILTIRVTAAKMKELCQKRYQHTKMLPGIGICRVSIPCPHIVSLLTFFSETYVLLIVVHHTPRVQLGSSISIGTTLTRISIRYI